MCAKGPSSTTISSRALPRWRYRKTLWHTGRSHGGGDRIKVRAHGRVTRDALEPVAGVPMVLGPLLVTGEEPGRCEGNHGERRHEGIRSGNGSLRTARLRDGREAASDQAKERVGREMHAFVGSNHGHGAPHENITSFKAGGMPLAW